jgi:hypothetical protein
MLKSILIAAAFALTAPAFAKDCSVGVFKTYIPNEGQKVCDDHGLPAEFTSGDEGLLAALQKKGYSAREYDQCAKGSNDPAAYSMITQMGDCSQAGNNVSCNFYVALIEEKTNKIVFENTMFVRDDASDTAYYFIKAMSALPNCSSL